MTQNVETTKMLCCTTLEKRQHDCTMDGYELVHNLLGKNATTSISSMLYVWYSGDTMQMIEYDNLNVV